MKPLLLLAFALLLPLAAWAQDAPGDTPDQNPPDHASPDHASPDQMSPDDNTQPAPPPKPTPTPDPPPPTWQPHQIAVLQALDKVDGQSSTLTLAVGQTQVYRNISINLRSCFDRPADQAQDAAAYLIIQDVGQTVPNFVGWMLAAEPATSMMQHPVYDVRVLGCR